MKFARDMTMLRIAAAMLSFTITAAIAAPNKSETAEKTADSGDKMVCKRFIKTGSLVDGYRECKTKREWERERNTLRAPSSEINSCRNSGGGGPC
jgi:hypothetical protein